MEFAFFGNKPEGLDEEALKEFVMGKFASSMSENLAINAKMTEIMEALTAYQIEYEKRSGGEDRNPMEKLRIDTIAHLSCFVASHKEMQLTAIEKKDADAIVAFSQDFGTLAAALMAVRSVQV